ncbi:hypothetical protein ACFVYD_32610 [Streptomyces sp. NPDC058301]|uniref:hypothetical protein n=1 Tax=Streptomyces sp. NPDC058301 TaxID=3346436 RepID=UPI0036E7F07E
MVDSPEATGVLVAQKSVGELPQVREVVLADQLDPSVEVFAAVIVHQRDERSDMLDRGLEFEACSAEFLQADGLLGPEMVRMGRDPAQSPFGLGKSWRRSEVTTPCFSRRT